MKLNEPNTLKVRLHRIEVGRPVRSVRVMLTGDWHISPIVSERQLEFLKEAVAEAEPDLIILQGDIVDSPIELRRETSLKKLMAELKLCSAMAPTVLVLGSHDYITPTRPARNMAKFALPFWKKICQKCGVKLLLNEWAEFPGIRIFGLFQDSRCLVVEDEEKGLHFRDSAQGFLKCLKDNEEVMTNYPSRSEVKPRPKHHSERVWTGAKASAADDEGKSVAAPEPKLEKAANGNEIVWFAAHAPLFNGADKEVVDEIVERLGAFDVASFGHTHGGIVPRGLDEVFEKFGWHFGLISANHLPFPRRVRGVEPLSEGTMLAINPGMVASQFCAPRLAQNLNFLKAAEVSVIEINGEHSGKQSQDMGEYFK